MKKNRLDEYDTNKRSLPTACYIVVDHLPYTYRLINLLRPARDFREHLRNQASFDRFDNLVPLAGPSILWCVEKDITNIEGREVGWWATTLFFSQTALAKPPMPLPYLLGINAPARNLVCATSFLHPLILVLVPLILQ